MSVDEVTTVEGWLTFVYFWLLVLLAYGADKLNAHLSESQQDESTIKE